MSTVTDAATEYAALSALGAGIAEAQRAAAEKVVRFTQDNGITKGTLDTPLGPVTLRQNKASTEIVITDGQALIAWCEQNLPSAVKTVTTKTLLEGTADALRSDRLVRAGDQVIDSHTGEVVDFAEVRHRPGTAPTVSYGASETQREVKAAAAKVVAARASQLSGYVLEAHQIAKAIEAGIDD